MSLMMCVVLAWHIFSGSILTTHQQLYISCAALTVGFCLMVAFALKGEAKSIGDDSETESGDDSETAQHSDTESTGEEADKKTSRSAP